MLARQYVFITHPSVPETNSQQTNAPRLADMFYEHKNFLLRWSATMTYLSLEGVNDKLKVLRVDTFNAFLYDVVAVLVLHALQHMFVQLRHDLHLRNTHLLTRIYVTRICVIRISGWSVNSGNFFGKNVKV